MMKRSHDVIIIGAGPAGATLAYELASKGIEVLVLEKETLPRYKCCAGGITIAAAKILSIDVQELAEDFIRAGTLIFKGVNPYHGCYEPGLMYTVMRDKLDCALVNEAEKAGATVCQNQGIKEMRSSAEGIEVETGTGSFRSRFLVGADGVYSLVARRFGLRNSAVYLAGIETEVQVPQKDLLRLKSQVVLDLGCVPEGYGWAFPKLDHLSIGIACPSSKAKGLKRRYRQFLGSLNIDSYTVTRTAGSLIPVCRGDSSILSQGRVAIVGDAAGLVNPLTGEGIYNAVLSARLAASAIQTSLSHGDVDLNDYQKAVQEKIVVDMKIAYALSRILSQFPSLVFRLAHQNERVWKGCCYLLRGEVSYSRIKEKLNELKPVQPLLQLLFR